MLSVIGGLWVMSGSDPLAAQAATPSASRSFSAAEVAPEAEFTVTIELANVGLAGRVTETLPAGFTYVGGSVDSVLDVADVTAAPDVVFTLLGDTSFTYRVMAPSAEGGPHTFSGELRAADGMDYQVSDDSEVTVVDRRNAGAPEATPEATPEALPPLPIPDLDNLTDAQAQAIFSATDGNSVAYTAEGADAANIVARVSPGAEALVTINLGITVPAGQQINFSLTDGDNFKFQIKKTGDATAMIVAKEGVELTSGRYNFELVVNEFGNAPANTSDIDVQVHVVIDNEPPEFTTAPESGTVAERARDSGTVAELARDAEIATFSATDINNQVLKFEIAAKIDEETGLDMGAAQILPSLIIGEYSGVLRPGP